MKSHYPKIILVCLLMCFITTCYTECLYEKDTLYPILIYLQTSNSLPHHRISIPIDNPDLNIRMINIKEKLVLNVQYKNISCKTSISNTVLCMTDSIVVILNPEASKKEVSIYISMQSTMYINKKRISVDEVFFPSKTSVFHTIYLCKPHTDWNHYCLDETEYYYNRLTNDPIREKIDHNIAKYYNTNNSKFLYKAMSIVNKNIKKGFETKDYMNIYYKIYLCKKLFLFEEGYDFINSLPNNIKAEYFGKEYDYYLKDFESGIYHKKGDYAKRDSINRILTNSYYDNWNQYRYPNYFSTSFGNYLLTKLRYVDKKMILNELDTYPVENKYNQVAKDILIKRIERFELNKVYGN